MPKHTLLVFWLQGRANAREFRQYPSVYCKAAGGQIVTNPEGRRFCNVRIDPQPQ